MSGQAHFEVYPQVRFEPDASQPNGERRVPTGAFGWRLRAANGELVAAGGEGFTRREVARRAVVDTSAIVAEMLSVGVATGDLLIVDLDEHGDPIETDE